jgi:hypothetical protein
MIQNENRMRSHAIVLGLAALVLGPSACAHTREEAPSPLVTQEFVIPDAGVSQDSVLALNGAPERREQVDDQEMWVYSRFQPEGSRLRSKVTTVWFREGVVHRTEVREGGAVPTPTFPAESGG